MTDIKATSSSLVIFLYQGKSNGIKAQHENDTDRFPRNCNHRDLWIFSGKVIFPCPFVMPSLIVIPLFS